MTCIGFAEGWLDFYDTCYGDLLELYIALALLLGEWLIGHQFQVLMRFLCYEYMCMSFVVCDALCTKLGMTHCWLVRWSCDCLYYYMVILWTCRRGDLIDMDTCLQLRFMLECGICETLTLFHNMRRTLVLFGHLTLSHKMRSYEP